MHQFYAILNLTMIAMLVSTASEARADDYDTRYFQGLRQRSLHTLAEGILTRRLKETTLTERERQKLVLELSTTYADHASTKFDDADELWEQAVGIIDAFLKQTISEQIHAECKVQRGVVLTLQGIHHYRLSELLGGDAKHQSHSKQILNEAIKSLTTSQISLNELLERLRPTRLSTARIRGLLDQTSYQLANAYVHQAVLYEKNLVEKSNALLQAIRLLTPLVEGSPDETITAQCQVLFAQALRIKRDGKRLDFFVEKLAKANRSPRIMDSLIAEQVRLLLDKNKPTEAATKLLERQREVRKLADELVFLQVKTLLSMRAIATSRMNTTLADELFAQAERIVTSLVGRSSGYWPTLAKLTLQRTQKSADLGPKLAGLVSAATSAYRNNKLEEAAKLYQQAFDQAVADKQTAVIFELGMSAGELSLKLKQLNEAAEIYVKVEQHSASEENAAQAHLMRCYILSQSPLKNTTQLSSLLEEHLLKYGSQPTVAEIYWMQGNVFVGKKRYQDAIASFLNVPANHERASAAVLKAAKCCQQLKEDSKKELQRELTQSVDAVMARISDLSQRLPNGNTDLLRAELAMIDIQVSGRIADRNETERQLARIAASVSTGMKNNLDQSELLKWQAANSQTTTLRVANHILAGQFDKAETLLKSAFQQKAVDPVGLLNRLHSIQTADRQQNFAIGKIMLLTANAAQSSNRSLSADEKKLIEKSVLDAYLRHGDLEKAITSLERKLQNSPKDKQLKIRLAKLMQASGSPKQLERAIPIWRSLEASAKPGSENWYDFRLSYAETLLAQGQQNQCRKLIAITKALYPKIPNDSLKKRLNAILAGLK